MAQLAGQDEGRGGVQDGVQDEVQVKDQSAAWQTGFMLIQGNRLESLRGLMTTWLRRYPLHPLENEVVLVQSNGIGQWLKLALAAPARDGSGGDDLDGGCGIAAAVDLMLPARFLWQTYRAVLGELPETSAYEKTPLSWRLYRLLGDLDAQAVAAEQVACLEPLRGFLAVDGDARRRQQLAERLADLYDQYQVYRADWLAAWQQGEDVLIRPNGKRDLLPESQCWQPLLWRRLQQDLQQHLPPDQLQGASRAEIHQRFLSRAASLSWQTRPTALPRRVIVFGISSLPRQAIEVLQAIAPVTQVMLFVQNPSRHYWGDIVEGRELFRSHYRRSSARKVPEDVDETELHLHGHPLLAAWGKQGRDYIRLLDEYDEREQYEAHFQAQSLTIDLFESAGGEDDAARTLLQQLQDDILELRPLAERQAAASAIDPTRDHSLRFLVAHSPQREVEILHDQLLEAFAEADRAGAPLPPRQILVMVPDIATYAPSIAAVFGRLAVDDPRRIPFHIADQGLRQRDPLLIGVEQLLNLPQARFAVSEVFDLLEIPAVRARFGLDESDLPRLRQWIDGANIRWGLDARQRARLGLPDGLEQNSWQFGLQRMLLGFATGASGAWQGIEPFDEVAGLEAALIGSLAELLETLNQAWQALQQPRTPADWSALLAEQLDALFLASSEADEWALASVRQVLEQWLLDCAMGGVEDELLPLEVVRDSLLTGLDAPTLSQRFLAGAVNFATLMPMRAIPFRQIWLLGMNDGDYPRSRRPADFDLMANDYRPGDRSRREDDRYLFLEALLAARERLVISWVGRSIRDNSERPASVLVGQLRDHLAAGWQLAGSRNPVDGAGEGHSGQALVAALTTEHPLQPFSRRYFQPLAEAGRDPRLFTFASEWQAMHRRLTEQPAEPPPRLGPATFEGPIRLSLLGDFLRYPVKTFYRQRLSLYLDAEVEQRDDEEPFDLDGLGSWGLRSAILSSIQQRLVAEPTVATEDCLQVAIARLARAGQLPMRPFDAAWVARLGDELSLPLARFRALAAEHPLRLPVQPVQLETDGLRLEDSLAGLCADTAGNRLRLTLQPSRLLQDDKPKWYHLVRHWPAHLAAQQAGPTTTCLLGPETEIMLSPLSIEEAETELCNLMSGYRRGLSELLPLACKTAFASLMGEQGRPVTAYEGGFNQNGECMEHAGYRRFWPSYAALSGDTRFHALVDQLYRPLVERVRHGTSGRVGGEPQMSRDEQKK
ncbi:MAG: exodeoxyribonuclease V subunit gamma [Chromatiaceae bacterium]|nr:exodeoxyribonuclease V subunit gamma [Chromatiaceae bacterium]MCF7993701.1 exodeoxyribonuclease V subunit gamma [Chromatiaceae bacterium]